MRSTVGVPAVCVCAVAGSIALGADIKLKSGEVIRGDIKGRIVLKAAGDAKAKAKGGDYVLFRGRDVLSIDESGVKLQGDVTLVNIGCGETDAKALALADFDQDGFGKLADGCSRAVFSTGRSHHAMWDVLYKSALEQYVREGSGGVRQILCSKLVLLGDYDGKEVLASLGLTTTSEGAKAEKSVPVASVVAFK